MGNGSLVAQSLNLIFIFKFHPRAKRETEARSGSAPYRQRYFRVIHFSQSRACQPHRG